jgi:uncharacterized protein
LSQSASSDLPPAASSGLTHVSQPDLHFDRARTSLRQALNRYTQPTRFPRRHPQGVELQAALKAELDRLSNALDKLNHSVFRIAVFGLVSRGKSAVLNALLGQKILQTGPLHGVTQYPRSIYWSPTQSGVPVNVELIDTPGLDEVGGQLRETMAREVVQQADLILFVIAGDITRTEYRALAELQETHKPLLLVFNKIDLYPDLDRYKIYKKLQSLFSQSKDNRRDRPLLSPDEIVLVAAEPAPIEVRVEYPDGRVSHEWESMPSQVNELRHKLVEILNREGKSLLALNALRQARDGETAIAQTTLKLHQTEAEDLIWQFAQWKSIAVALNPIAVLDLMGGAITDLVMIRSLARLYGLPMTSYEAGKLWNTILWSSGGLLLGEVGSGLLLGAGKSASAVVTMFDSPTGLMAYGGAAIAQASLAGYGTYRVGKAAQIYLEKGCTWGAQGANTVIQDILNQVEPDTILYRLRRELTGKETIS